MVNDYKSYCINSIVMKIVAPCNLRCDYCYRNINSDEHKPHIMDISMVEKCISEYIDCTPNVNKPLVMVWHGGEPLIAGIDYFKEILNLQKKLGPERQFINVIQTNATLIDEKWAHFIKDNNITIGVSLDGPKEYNDLHRKNAAGESSFEMTKRGLCNLKKVGKKFSAICVISNENYDKATDFLDFFVEVGASVIDFIPCYDYNLKYTLTNERYEHFMKTVYDYWMNKHRDDIKIRFLQDVMKKIVCASQDKSCYVECELSDMCGRNIAILDNGDVYACACLTPVEEMKLGNINSLSLKDLANTTAFKNMVNEYNDVNKKCLSCDVKKVCSTGCLNRRLSKYNESKLDCFCEARRAIIKHVEESLPKYFPV